MDKINCLIQFREEEVEGKTRYSVILNRSLSILIPEENNEHIYVSHMLRDQLSVVRQSLDSDLLYCVYSFLGILLLDFQNSKFVVNLSS